MRDSNHISAQIIDAGMMVHSALGPRRLVSKLEPSASLRALRGGAFPELDRRVRSRDAGQLNAGIEQGHLSACLPHLANIACAAGRTLTFDPATETFQADAEASALLTRKYREPHVVTTEV